MNNFSKRTIAFVIFIPLVFGSLLLVPEPNHLLFCIIAIIAGLIGSVELSAFFEKRDIGYRAGILFVPIIGIVFPITTLLLVTGVISRFIMNAVITGTVAFIFALQITRRREENFPRSLTGIAATLTLLIYPGYFLSHIIRMTTLPESSIVITVFLISVFLNDTAAYTAGKLFGKKSKKPIPVSPNKSLVGFIMGLLFSIIVIFTGAALFPEAFPGALFKSIILGTISGAAVITGDLVESAMKRSVKIKDSGYIIPGRGGILDSIDSPIFSAVFFYYLFVLLYLF
jgi:phosphatidate cytidylyltransferase